LSLAGDDVVGISCAPTPPMLGSVLRRRSLVDLSFFSMVAWSRGRGGDSRETESDENRETERGYTRISAGSARQLG